MLKTALIIIFVLIIVFIILILVSDQKMTRVEDKLTEQLRRQTGKQMVQNSKLEELPEPVKSYFDYALGDNDFNPRYVKVHQSGFFRFLKDDSKFNDDQGWKKMTATQHFSICPSGFYWFAKIRMNILMWIRGWDSYHRGKGRMRWKANSLVSVMNAEGKKLDEGSLYRYLAESVWFPTALLPENGITWTAIDHRSAEASIWDSNITASVMFFFNEKNQIHKMSAKRYRENNGGYVEGSWHAYYHDYRSINGFKIPFKGDVSWEMPHGEMKYVRLKIDAIVHH